MRRNPSFAGLAACAVLMFLIGFGATWWQWQRAHGLCVAVRQGAEQADLEQIARRLETPTGLQGLRRLFKRALPREYRHAV